LARTAFFPFYLLAKGKKRKKEREKKKNLGGGGGERKRGFPATVFNPLFH